MAIYKQKLLLPTLSDKKIIVCKRNTTKLVAAGMGHLKMCI